MVTIEQFVGLHSQMNEIMKRVGNESLDPAAVKRALQGIVEGKLPAESWPRPSWYRMPGQQEARAHRLWPDIRIPSLPANFTSRTATEVLLLHVPDTFDNLWDKVEAPEGYTKYRWEGVKADKRHLRLAPNKREYTEPVWLAFDPEHGRGKRPDSLWGQGNLAASEVLSALIQFPDWPMTWYMGGASAPNLSGYQLKRDTIWAAVPYLDRQGVNRRLELRVDWSDFDDPAWASPSVREC